MRVQEGCERRSEVIVKIKKKIGVGVCRVSGWGVRVRGSGWVEGGGQGGCERRSEVFVKKKTIWGGGGSDWGVRVDVKGMKKCSFCEN